MSTELMNQLEQDRSRAVELYELLYNRLCTEPDNILAASAINALKTIVDIDIHMIKLLNEKSKGKDSREDVLR